MNPLLRYALSVICLSSLATTLAAPATPRTKEALETATRLQIFLDRAQFGPGKIDGRDGEFTVRALELYRRAKGDAPATASEARRTTNSAPLDTNGLDLTSADPVFVDYTVTDDDVKAVGPVPEAIPEKAKLKTLAYKTAAEGVAEKFHTDADFLAELNPGKTNDLKAGDIVTVPNVEPFDLSAVKSITPGSETTPQAANDVDDSDASIPDTKKDSAAKEPPLTISVKVDTKTNMLTVYDADRLIAAYPVTIGSGQTESPIGDWKVKGVAKMPNFRYDKAMLNKGERSKDFHMLPPGPNNPVGVIWIALNKKGIGLHGTNDPDSIGRSASHGCIRLANWDIVRLAAKIKFGVPVSIH